MTSGARLVRWRVVSLAALVVAVGCASPPSTIMSSDAGIGGSFDAAADGTPVALCQIGAKPIPERSLTLTSADVAVRLAGFLWRKPADGALLQRAATLRTTKDVAALALEMQKDVRINGGLDAFTNSWLELDALPRSMPADFVGFDAPLSADMNESALRFVRAVFADPNGTLSVLMTSSMVVSNERLAPFFGVSFDSSAGQWQQIQAPAGQRAGVSTLLARLTAAPRITQRGMWIGSRLLCQTAVPPPPPGFSPVADGAASYRQRLEMVTAGAACFACHLHIDNSGFAFEHFDDVGRFRQDDHGFAIDTKSALSLGNGTVLAFDGPADLMGLVGHGCDGEVCFVESWLGQALGAGNTLFTDSDTVALVLGAFHSADRQLGALLAAITETPAFLAP